MKPGDTIYRFTYKFRPETATFVECFGPVPDWVIDWQGQRVVASKASGWRATEAEALQVYIDKTEDDVQEQYEHIASLQRVLGETKGYLAEAKARLKALQS